MWADVKFTMLYITNPVIYTDTPFQIVWTGAQGLVNVTLVDAVDGSKTLVLGEYFVFSVLGREMIDWCISERQWHDVQLGAAGVFGRASRELGNYRWAFDRYDCRV